MCITLSVPGGALGSFHALFHSIVRFHHEVSITTMMLSTLQIGAETRASAVCSVARLASWRSRD